MYKQIYIPTHCPSCNELLESTDAELFCRNTEDCPAQNTKKLENFTKVMKIKGLGEKSIEKIFQYGCTTIPELYALTEQDLVDILGTANGKKVYVEIQESKSQKLELFIQALGIKTIAESSAKLIASKINDLTELPSLLQDSFVKELGQVKHSNLVTFLNSELYKRVLELDLALTKTSVQKPAKINGCVCITGKLQDFSNRKAAEEYLTSLGWECKSSVTSAVTHLICEDDTKKSSSSYQKAVSKGIPILTIKQLTSL